MQYGNETDQTEGWKRKLNVPIGRSSTQVDFKGSDFEDDPQPTSDDEEPDPDQPDSMMKVDVMVK